MGKSSLAAAADADRSPCGTWAVDNAGPAAKGGLSGRVRMGVVRTGCRVGRYRKQPISYRRTTKAWHPSGEGCQAVVLLWEVGRKPRDDPVQMAIHLQ